MSEQVRAAPDRLSQAIAILEQERARISGSKKFTGKECETCGESVRYTATGRCVECAFRSTEESRKVAELDQRLRDALASEARAWARVAELEDKYEPRDDVDIARVAL